MISCIVGKTEINTLEYKDEQLRNWSKKKLLRCPVCGEELQYCNGDFKIAYFRHLKNSNCIGDKFSEPETEEHISGKKIIYEWLKENSKISNLKLEGWIPETKQRPDIYFEYENKRYVIEFQCSPISTEYVKRHELYKLADINDIWILGTDKYNINLSRERCSKRFKVIEKEIYNLKHNIMYLNKDNIYTIKDLEYIPQDSPYYHIETFYKTKFNYNLECNNINNIDIKYLNSISILNDKLRYNDKNINHIIKYVNYINKDILNYSKYYFGIRNRNKEDEEYLIYSSGHYVGTPNIHYSISLSKYTDGHFDNNVTEIMVKANIERKLKLSKSIVLEAKNMINKYVYDIDNNYSIDMYLADEYIGVSLKYNFYNCMNEHIDVSVNDIINLDFVVNNAKALLNKHFSTFEQIKNRDINIEYINKLCNNLDKTKLFYNYDVENKERYILLTIDRIKISIYNDYLVFNEFYQCYKEKEKLYFKNYKEFQNIICSFLRNIIYDK